MLGFEMDETIDQLITSTDYPFPLTTLDISVLSESSYAFDPTAQTFSVSAAEIDQPVINTPEVKYYGVDRIRAYAKEVIYICFDNITLFPISQ